MLFIDYSKAFDRVDHTIVLRKLAVMGANQSIIKWMHSFLQGRQQRVKVGSAVSQWITRNGGMPQGAWLGPNIFVVYIDDLQTVFTSIKFIDDVTTVDVMTKSCESNMQAAANQLAQWSAKNLMTVNTKKTKEMVFGSAAALTMPCIKLNNENIERVESFKLLGVIITNDLTWDKHIAAICSRANQRLHFLTLLRRAAVSRADMLHYHTTVIRPVIEYACPLWQSNLTVEQKHQLERVQQRAIYIITDSADYELQCALLDIEPIYLRLDRLTRDFFYKMRHSNSCLHWLCRLNAHLTSQTIYDKLHILIRFCVILSFTNGHFAIRS